MKKLLKHLSPFAPDQSGAVSALFECGGLIVICDAGGCTGNICGFDEPRWFSQHSAVFSAALRDMDAILGRDRALVGKIQDAASVLNPAFTALIGTPVPAVIGTDYRALSRMVQKATGLPCLAFETTGTAFYDCGVSRAHLELFRQFALDDAERQPAATALIGATPLDLSCRGNAPVCQSLRNAGFPQCTVCGMGAGLDSFRHAAGHSINLVAAPAGLAAAQYLQKRFGTPYRPFFPESLLPDCPPEECCQKRILVIHQQFAANALRHRMIQAGAASVDVASFFQLADEYRQPQDFILQGEEDFADKVASGGYSLIAGDRALRHALPDYRGEWLDFPHFAISGELLA